MADTAVNDDLMWVPADNFGARLALIRQHMGWNVKEAAEFCGINSQTWHNWEAGKSPRNMDRVCRSIAEAVGCNYVWLMTGGPLARSRCFSLLPPVPGQMELPLLAELPSLVAV